MRSTRVGENKPSTAHKDCLGHLYHTRMKQKATNTQQQLLTQLTPLLRACPFHTQLVPNKYYISPRQSGLKPNGRDLMYESTSLSIRANHHIILRSLRKDSLSPQKQQPVTTSASVIFTPTKKQSALYDVVHTAEKRMTQHFTRSRPPRHAHAPKAGLLLPPPPKRPSQHEKRVRGQ